MHNPHLFPTEPSLHSGSDVQKKKRRSLKDFRLILEGWVVGFEPTTFRTTSGVLCNYYLLMINCLYCVKLSL